VVRPVSEIKVPSRDKSFVRKPHSLAQKDFSPLPSSIKPPTIEELQAMQTKLEALTEPLPEIYAAYYGEDWKTQGDWYGRITSEFGILCAMDAPFNHNVYWPGSPYVVRPFIGPNYPKEDILRFWLHWRRTSDRRSLWNVFYAFRRQAEWDDHGEVYPWTMDGPDLWYLLHINHPGVFQVSMYFFNKDGHDGSNRMRDYMIEIYPSPRPWIGVSENWKVFSELAEEQVRHMPPLAKSRMRDFWGGVHKQFVFKGPGWYFVKIRRNNSFNTTLSGVMIRQLHGKPNHLHLLNKQQGMYSMGGLSYDPPPFPKEIDHETGDLTYRLWNLLDEKYDRGDNLNYQQRFRIATLVASNRVADDAEDVSQLAESIKWRLNQWDDKQRKEYEEAMLHGWKEHFRTSAGRRKLIQNNKARFPQIYKEPYYNESYYPEFQNQDRALEADWLGWRA
jgi:hypothetical protein